MLHDHIPANTPDLYHYSNRGGLLGIVNSGQLWLSNASFLNDAQEYSYGLNLIEEVMHAEYAPLFRVDVRVNSSITNDISPIFCMSLTEEEDLLSQWRGYCPNGGYSFALDKQQLNDAMAAENNAVPGITVLEIGKCIYDKDEQIEYIKRILAASLPSPDIQPFYLAWERSEQVRSELSPLAQKRADGI